MPETIDEAIAEAQNVFNAEAAKGEKCVYQFNITGEGGKEFNFVIDDGTLTVNEGQHESPGMTVTMEASDYLDMLSGKLDAQMVFMSGKMKAQGDIMGLGMKMKTFFPTG